jgi:hypothetical protein
MKESHWLKGLEITINKPWKRCINVTGCNLLTWLNERIRDRDNDNDKIESDMVMWCDWMYLADVAISLVKWIRVNHKQTYTIWIPDTVIANNFCNQGTYIISMWQKNVIRKKNKLSIVIEMNIYYHFNGIKNRFWTRLEERERKMRTLSKMVIWN